MSSVERVKDKNYAWSTFILGLCKGFQQYIVLLCRPSSTSDHNDNKLININNAEGSPLI